MSFDISGLAALAADIGNSLSPDRLTINGKVLTTTTGALNTTDAGFLPDGVRNATNSDLRYFLLTTADIGAAGLRVDSMETQTVNYRNSDYVVVRVLVQGAQSTAKLVCYRMPQVGTSTQDAAQLDEFAYVAPT